jgi:biopolymer transport protein ExbD
MSFGSNQIHDDSHPPMAEINMVPLIDVMLVLLVIFLVTAPLLTHSVKLELPKASSAPHVALPSAIELSINAEGALHWNGETIRNDELNARLSSIPSSEPRPALHIKADRTTPYEKVAQVMSHASRLGITQMGFITDPAQP